MQLKISEAAEEDIKYTIKYGLRKFGERQTDRYIEGLFNQIDKLLEGIAAERIHNERFYKTQFKQHVIYYKKEESDGAGCINIIRILNGRMDADRYLH